MRTRHLALFAVAAGFLSGCGTSDDKAEIRDITTRFYAAVREDRGEDACEFLSAEARSQLESQTGQQCDDVITRLQYDGGEVEAVAVYVTNAKVEMSSGESVFAALEPDGWRLTALACKAETGKPRDRPFECELEA